VARILKRLLQNLGRFSCPLTLLSQYLPIEHEAIREGALENDAAAIIGTTFDEFFDFMARPAVAPAT
jgi:tagatose-1,6-bisphosphate aldolase non-catalytic subunit AgaZ/GatZ